MAEILLGFGSLFHIESVLKEKQAGPDQIVATRSEKSLPVFTDLLSKIEKLSSGSLLQGKASKACNYFINPAAQVQVVLFHGNCPITSNKVERCVKSFVLARRSFLACTGISGAENLCTLFTVCKTAIENGLNLERYLTYVFERLAFEKNSEELIGELLPYSRKLPQQLYEF